MKQIYICNSIIEGRGIRAGEDIKKGETITIFRGPLKFKINKNKRDALSHPDWVGVKKDYWIDPEKPQKFLNHSCSPNACIKTKLSLVAFRDIKEGEEITFDYSTIEGDSRWEMKCLCHEKNCRKVISSVHSLPEKQFIKYLPYIPNYFKKVYLSLHPNLQDNNDFSKI
jgi:SET domain-containing protein